MKSKETSRLKEAGTRMPAWWTNRLCWLPVISAAITLIPAFAFVFIIWKDLPEINFLEIPNYGSLASFFVTNLGARTFWGVSLLFFVVSALIAIVLTGYVIVQAQKEYPKLQRLVVLGIVLLISITAGALLKRDSDDKTSSSKEIVRISEDKNDGGYYGQIFKPILRQIDSVQVAKFKIKNEERERPIGDFTTLNELDNLVDWINVLLTISGLMLVFGFSASLYTPQKVERLTVQEVRSQRQRLLLVLYSGTAMLISGVIATYAYVRVPSAFAVGIIKEHMNEVAFIITIAVGVIFTLYLAGIYLPASIVISARAKGLADGMAKEDPKFDRDEWLEKQNLATSHVQHLTRTVAVLAPLLASLSQIVGNFF